MSKALALRNQDLAGKVAAVTYVDLVIALFRISVALITFFVLLQENAATC